MGKYSVVFAANTIKELEKHKKAGNKAINTKIDEIFNELKNTPFTGEGQSEPLKYSLTGLWSRRINREHRIVYRVEENIVTVFVVSAMGHYSDK
jgi:toxin YoeB